MITQNPLEMPQTNHKILRLIIHTKGQIQDTITFVQMKTVITSIIFTFCRWNFWLLC